MSTENVTFLDTGGLFALLSTTDEDHDRGRRWAKGLRGGQALCVTTDYIVDETAVLLVTRRVRHALPELFAIVADSGFCRIEWIGPERFARARDLMLSHTDKTYSFTDCTSFVVMRDLGIRRALTKDRHFEQAGFEAILA